MKLLLFDISIVLLAKKSLAQSCYSPDGNVVSSDLSGSDYTPCSGIDGPTTICCANNRTNPPYGNISVAFTRDICLPNGLCENRYTEDGERKTTWWRDYCTNSDVTSADCLDICLGSADVDKTVQLTPCTGRADSEKWCCGASNACCTNNIGTVLLPRVFGGELSSNQTSSSTVLSSVSQTQSPASSPLSASTDTTSPAESKPSSNSLSGGAIAGIVIGVVAGVACLAAAIFFARKAKMWKKMASTSTPETAAAPNYTPLYASYRQELDDAPTKYSQSPVELPPAPPSELPSGAPPSHHSK